MSILKMYSDSQYELVMTPAQRNKYHYCVELSIHLHIRIRDLKKAGNIPRATYYLEQSYKYDKYLANARKSAEAKLTAKGIKEEINY